MYLSQINRDLTTLSNECKQKDSNGKTALNEALEILKTRTKELKKKYTIDRFIISGSVGRKTSVKRSDFDAFVFINHVEASGVNEIVGEFNRILKTWTNAQDLAYTHSALKFKLNDFAVRLVPLGNYAQEIYDPYTGTATPEEYAAVSVAIMYEIPFKYHSTSATIAEGQVDFMKEVEQTSSFVHDLVILCKYWNGKVNVSWEVKGRCELIELIAVQAGREFEMENKNVVHKMYFGFLKFLSLIKDFSGLKICFDPSRSPPPTAPFVIQPAGPFVNNDLARSLESFQVRAFEEKAEETYSRLEQAKDNCTSIESIFA